MNERGLTRRNFMKSAALAGAGTAMSSMALQRAFAEEAGGERRFLIVLCASGGACLTDSLLAIRASESTNAATLNTYPDAVVQNIAGSPFRAIDSSGSAIGSLPVAYTANQSSFVRRHRNDIMVATHTGTSVNHAVAQKRSVTGNEAWSGRTLQELVARQYGRGLAIPNVAMATGTSFIDPGTDRSLPEWCFAEPVAVPALWPLSLDGSRGIPGAPAADRIHLARRMRDEKLDPRTKFNQTFKKSPRLRLWERQRAATTSLEAADLITQLMLFENSAKYPLTRAGLAESPAGDLVRAQFPRFADDPLEAQAALAFLLLKNRASVAVTIGPSFNAELADDASLNGGLVEGDLLNPPIAFDFSHQAHRATQAFMWDRTMRVADGLITLLKGEEYGDGQSMWDRSLIYIATDFGRDKTRIANATDFGTSHHLNNGVVVISPMANGNRVLGGVDPNTGMTFGFDLESGAPLQNRQMSERDIFSGILGALRVDRSGSGLPDARAMRKTA